MIFVFRHLRFGKSQITVNKIYLNNIFKGILVKVIMAQQMNKPWWKKYMKMGL